LSNAESADDHTTHAAAVLRRNGVSRVITTVHGTYASDATWVLPDSKLGAALTRWLGPRTVVVPCRWSGGNNPIARDEGQQTLRNHLSTVMRQHPGAEHFIIAHSHGGNVALYAMRDDVLRNGVRGVVCLATPFIVARPRLFGGDDAVLPLAGATIIPMLIVWLLAAWFIPTFGTRGTRELLLTAMLIIGFIVAYVVLLAWKRFAARLVPMLRLPSDFPAKKLLLIRAVADEAGAGLAFVQFVSQLNVRAYHLLDRRRELLRDAFARWEKRRGSVIAALAAGVLTFTGLIVLLTTVLVPSVWSGVIVIVAAGVLVVLPALMLARRSRAAAAPLELASYAILFGVICGLSVLLLPFGRHIAAASAFLDVTAEATPPGEWTVRLLAQDPVPIKSGELRPLQHSLLYDNDEAIGHICAWIERLA
jgi:hypothetical protein